MHIYKILKYSWDIFGKSILETEIKVDINSNTKISIKL